MGFKPHTLRYYEERAFWRRNMAAKGVRVYIPTRASNRLSMICCLRATGMPIKDMQQYFALCDAGDGTIQERLEIFEAHRRHILAEIEGR